MRIIIELELSNNKLLHYDVKTIEQGQGRPKKINEILIKKNHVGRPKKIVVDVIPIPPILPPVIPNKEVVTVPTDIPAPQPPVEVPKINPEAPIPNKEDDVLKRIRIDNLKHLLATIEKRKALKSKVAANAK